MKRTEEMEIYHNISYDLSWGVNPPEEYMVLDFSYSKRGVVFVEIYKDTLYIDSHNVVCIKPADPWLDHRKFLIPKYTGSRVWNARLLELLHSRQEFIPQAWRDSEKKIMFPGTIFRSKNYSDRKYWIPCLSIGSNGDVSKSVIDIHSTPDSQCYVALCKRREHCN